LWVTASVLVIVSHLRLIRAGILRGRIELATNGLLENGRDLLKWDKIGSWKWRAGPSPVLVIRTGGYHHKLRMHTGIVRQFPIPEQLEAHVNRLLLEYRGNGPYPPESNSTSNAAHKAS
jgi:hypothetical protein